MLNEMKMYQSTTKTSSVAHTKLDRQVYIRSNEKGIFYSNHSAGDVVKEGETVGRTTDEFGKVLFEYKAPHAGIILYKIATPPINAGDTVMCISYSS